MVRSKSSAELEKEPSSKGDAFHDEIAIARQLALQSYQPGYVVTVAVVVTKRGG